MKKHIITVLAATLLLSTSATFTSLAVETQPQQIISYNQSQVKSLGTWEQQTDGKWKFKQFTGSYLTSSWIESQTTAGDWYFVDVNGYMLTNAVTPDNYTVDANGVWRATVSNSGSHSNNGGTQTSNNSTGNQQGPSQGTQAGGTQDNNSQEDVYAKIDAILKGGTEIGGFKNNAPNLKN